MVNCTSTHTHTDACTNADKCEHFVRDYRCNANIQSYCVTPEHIFSILDCIIGVLLRVQNHPSVSCLQLAHIKHLQERPHHTYPVPYFFQGANIFTWFNLQRPWSTLHIYNRCSCSSFRWYILFELFMKSLSASSICRWMRSVHNIFVGSDSLCIRARLFQSEFLLYWNFSHSVNSAAATSNHFYTQVLGTKVIFSVSHSLSTWSTSNWHENLILFCSNIILRETEARHPNYTFCIVYFVWVLRN